MTASETHRDSGDRMPHLDLSQRAVLGLAAGHSAVVLGAPGSGKTTTLVEFVADRVLGEGLDPAAILALAPSRTSATALRDRIGARLGITTAGPLARTANSLAFDIVTHHRRSLGLTPPRLISGGEQDNDIATLLAGHVEDGSGPDWPETLGPDVRRLRVFRTELRELMMRVTERGISLERLRALGREHEHPEWVAVADFVQEYRDVLAFARDDQFDSAELARLAADLLDRGEPGELAGGLSVVLVDDLQEVSRSQLNLLAALVRRGVAVVGFGDPDVATSTFRGGEPRAVGEFGTLLGLNSVQTFVLSSVYRHGTELRAFTSRVTERIGTSGVVGHRSAESLEAALPAEIQAKSPGEVDDPAQAFDASIGAPVVSLRGTSQGRERASIARLLREHHIHRGVPWSKLGVIVRSGALAPGIARSLSLANVPTRTTAAGVALRDETAARALLAVVEVGIGRAELTPEVVVELLTGAFGGLDRLALRRLRLALRAEEFAGGGNRSSDDLLVEALAAPGRFVTIESHIAKNASHLASTLGAVRVAFESGSTIEELLWLVWDRSGLAETWRAEALGAGIAAAEANRALDGVLALFTAAKRFVERGESRGPELFLDGVLDAEVPEDTLAPQSVAESVLVTTPSGAVGLEFDVVVVAGLQDGVWPNLKPRGSLLAADEFARLVDGVGGVGGAAGSLESNRTDVLHDELRMFALAVSRAREQVVLTATANEDERESVFLALGPAVDESLSAIRPPLTLRGLTGQLRRVLAAELASGEVRAAAASGLAQLAAEHVPGADPDDWHGLAGVSTDQPVFANTELVRVSPSKLESFEESPVDWFIDLVSGSQTSPAMGLGTIVHGAMEHTPDSSIESVWKLIDERWSELLFEAPWIAEREKRAAQKIARGVSQYLRDFESEGKTLVNAEGRFTLELPPAVLSGSIDRVERDGDGGVSIVDLKTGKNKPSAKELAEHAQLRAYQLAYAEGRLDDVLEPLGEHHSAGAKLVFPRLEAKREGKQYSESAQNPLTPDQLKEFRERIRMAARLMAAVEFTGQLEVDEFSFGSAVKKLHRTRAVSGD